VAVEFRLPAAAFAQVDAAGQTVHAPGDFGLVVGSASPGPHAQALGAPAPATGKVQVV
jgi:beta-glucosidase